MRGQLYHGHYLIISPLHGHGEVANENPLILPRTLSIVGALVLLKRRAGKKMRAPLLGLREALYLLLFVFSFIWRMPNLKKFSKCLRKNGKVYHNGRRTKSRKPMISSKRTKVSTANLTQFILTFSHTNAICRGNNIISSAIWRK